MKKTTFKALLLIAITAILSSCNQQPQKEVATKPDTSSNAIALADATLQGDELIKTDFGDIQLNETYITQKSIKILNKQLQLQRAVSVYEWALPVATFQMWYNASSEVYGANDLDFVEYKSFNEKVGIITANATTPYATVG